MIDLTDDERALLAIIPPGGGLSSYFRIEGVSAQKRNKMLAHLEEMGLVERAPNAYGPETPWWWERLPTQDALNRGPGRVNGLAPTKGTVYDRCGESMVTFECNGETNEYGCAVGYLKAGENNARKAWVPLHLLNRYPWWVLRRRGQVTPWSAQFSCSVHGECSEDMVRTDKCCALCGTILNRH